MADDDEQFELSGELDSEAFASDSGIAGLSEELSEIPDAPLEEASAADDIADSSQDEADGADGADGAAVVAAKPKSILADFNIFDAMLTVSFVLITVASLLMLMALADYGGLTNAWRTTGISVK